MVVSTRLTALRTFRHLSTGRVAGASLQAACESLDWRLMNTRCHVKYMIKAVTDSLLHPKEARLN